MNVRRTWWEWAASALIGVFSLTGACRAASLAYETIEPNRITIGESATLRVTSLDGDLKDVGLPTVSGLAFEIVGHTQQFEFVGGTSVASTSIVIRVTPQMAGIFSIPGITPKSEPLVLVVDTTRDRGVYRSASPDARKMPTPPPLKAGALPKGAQLEAGGSAFVQLLLPARPVYVGESVPIDIEVGVRPGIVTSLNGLPTLNGGEFTLNNLSTRPDRQEKSIDGSPFVLMTWHSVLAAIKPGDFSISVNTPLTVRINTRSAEDLAFARVLGGPFLQNAYQGIVPKELTITSPKSELRVLPLPTEGRPRNFGGAVGTFRIASDVSSGQVAAGDPLTLRLHISGVGNFDRVDSAMLDHLQEWKTYPAKGSFSPNDSLGDKGEKVFEQPLIAAEPGERTIPGLSFSYFDPQTRRYELAQTAPIKVNILASAADIASPLQSSTTRTKGLVDGLLASALRPDHPVFGSAHRSLVPLYFRGWFAALPTSLALLFTGAWFTLRVMPARAISESLRRGLAQLDAASRSADTSVFFDVARSLLLASFAARWGVAPDQVTPAELKLRLGDAGEEMGRLLSLADEAKYSGYRPDDVDRSRWTQLIRRQLLDER